MCLLRTFESQGQTRWRLLVLSSKAISISSVDSDECDFFDDAFLPSPCITWHMARKPGPRPFLLLSGLSFQSPVLDSMVLAMFLAWNSTSLVGFDFATIIWNMSAYVVLVAISVLLLAMPSKYCRSFASARSINFFGTCERESHCLT